MTSPSGAPYGLTVYIRVTKPHENEELEGKPGIFKEFTKSTEKRNIHEY